MTRFFGEFCHSRIPRCAVVVLVALVWSGLAFCGEIHDATAKGDLEKVKALLENNPDLVFSKNTDGWTPLHVAVADEGYKEEAESIFAGTRAYHVTKSHNAISIAKLLIAERADVNAKDSKGWTPLCYAADKGNKVMAELLLVNKADVNAKATDGSTPLLLAEVKNQQEVINLLLAREADVNAKGKDDETPMHYAASMGQKSLVELLLAKKADVNFKDINGRTPLHQAAAQGHKEVVELLLANKADVNAKDNHGMTPLHYAVGRGQKEVVELLLANKADFDAVDTSGDTLLMTAVELGEPEMVEFLINHGADKTIKSNEGKTALDYAKSKPVPKPLSIEKIDANTVRISDGFLYRREMELSGAYHLNINGIENGMMKAEGHYPLGSEYAVGMTLIFTKPNLTLPNGGYIYRSLTNDASITFTNEGAVVKSFKIENPYEEMIEILANDRTKVVEPQQHAPMPILMVASQFVARHCVSLFGIVVGMFILCLFYFRLVRSRH